MSMSEARKRANKKWNDANKKNLYDQIGILVPKGDGAIIKAAAERAGKSVSEYVRDAIAAQMSRETQKSGDPE